MVLRLVGRGRVGHCQPSFLSGGGVDPLRVGAPTTVFLFVWWGCVWGVVAPTFLFCGLRGAGLGEGRTNLL